MATARSAPRSDPAKSQPSQTPFRDVVREPDAAIVQDASEPHSLDWRLRLALSAFQLNANGGKWRTAVGHLVRKGRLGWRAEVGHGSANRYLARDRTQSLRTGQFCRQVRLDVTQSMLGAR